MPMSGIPRVWLEICTLLQFRKFLHRNSVGRRLRVGLRELSSSLILTEFKASPAALTVRAWLAGTENGLAAAVGSATCR
jgi:hypothetical protein